MNTNKNAEKFNEEYRSVRLRFYENFLTVRSFYPDHLLY